MHKEIAGRALKGKLDLTPPKTDDKSYDEIHFIFDIRLKMAHITNYNVPKVIYGHIFGKEI